MKKNVYTIDQKTANIVRHILNARIDHSNNRDAYIAYCNARDVFEYALAGNKEALKRWDYLMTQEDVERYSNLKRAIKEIKEKRGNKDDGKGI